MSDKENNEKRKYEKPELNNLSEANETDKKDILSEDEMENASGGFGGGLCGVGSGTWSCQQGNYAQISTPY